MSLEEINDRLRLVLGLDPDSISAVGLRAAVRRRMRACGIERQASYAQRLRTDPGEFEQLANDVVVHETSFFRYPASFELLARDAKRHAGGELRTPYRVLCVACSTGEEPASVVMTLLGAGFDADRMHVDASDVSARAIGYAEEGLYRRRGVLRLPPEVRARWFQAEGKRFRLDPEVRHCIRLRRVNVHGEEFGYTEGPYDAIFCRNLMIYLLPEARVRLLRALIARLRPNGLLFVGHAEVSAARAHGLTLAKPADAFACEYATADTAVAKPAPGSDLAAHLSQASGLPAATQSPPVATRRPRTQTAARATPAATSHVSAPAAPETESALSRAARLAGAGDVDGARGVLLAVVGKGAATADHYHLLAVIEGARGRDVASGDALRRALYLDPEHYPSLVQAALHADAHGDRERAARLRAKAERIRTASEGAGHEGAEGGRP